MKFEIFDCRFSITGVRTRLKARGDSLNATISNPKSKIENTIGGGLWHSYRRKRVAPDRGIRESYRTNQIRCGPAVQDLLSAKLVRASVPHVRIGKIDTSKAAALKGVRAVLTGADVKIFLSVRGLKTSRCWRMTKCACAAMRCGGGRR